MDESTVLTLNRIAESASVVTRVQPLTLTLTIPPAPAPVTPPTQSILLSIEQVCIYLGGISESKIWELVSAGKIPAPKKLGRLSRWHRGELDAWADKL